MGIEFVVVVRFLTINLVSLEVWNYYGHIHTHTHMFIYIVIFISIILL